LPGGHITSNFQKSLSRPEIKIFRFAADTNQMKPNVLARLEGRSRRHDVGHGMRCDAAASGEQIASGRLMLSDRRSRGVLTPRLLARQSAIQKRSDGAKQAWSRGEREVRVRKTIAGECRVISGDRGDYCSYACFICHARIAGHRAHGIPCALRISGANGFCRTRAHARRGIADRQFWNWSAGHSGADRR